MLRLLRPKARNKSIYKNYEEEKEKKFWPALQTQTTKVESSRGDEWLVRMDTVFTEEKATHAERGLGMICDFTCPLWS